MRRAVMAMTCAAAMACDRAPIAWRRATRPAPPVGAWQLVLDARGTASSAPAPRATFVPPAGACASSVVFSRLGAREWFAAWWQPRRDGSAVLDVSRSVDDGATWTAPVAADARDRSTASCARPGPAIAADSTSGYVHLAYYLRAPEGAGLWFVHSMDRGATWHAPVGVFFGDDPAAASVAAHGDTVAVAYEYPVAGDARVGVAVSVTTGHLFELHAAVSPSTEAASDPRVAVRGPWVAVTWAARPPNADSIAPARLGVAVGTLRGGR